MEKVNLNALIRENEREGVEGVVAMATNYEVQTTKNRYSLFSFQRNNVEAVRRDFIQWANDNNFAVSYDQPTDVYTVKAPAATLTVNKNVCIIEELKGFYNNALSNHCFKNTNIDRLEAYIKNLPQLFNQIKTDEDYIRANFESEIAKKHKRQKLCAVRQTGVDILIRNELDKCGYKYSIRKNAVRTTVTIEVGDYLLDFPILNTKVTKMDDVIAQLHTIIDTVGKLPRNVKFKCKR